MNNNFAIVDELTFSIIEGTEKNILDFVSIFLLMVCNLCF